jgi:lipopolysaccharide export system permease protein
MLKIDRYIMQRFLTGVLPVLLLLLALFSFISLAEELEEVGSGDFKLIDALMVVFLTTPKRIVELLPVTALLGGLLGLGAMANHRELIAIRTSGISKARIAQTVTVLAIILAVFITILQFTVVPGFEREAAQLRGKSLQGTDKGPGSEGAFWTRNGAYFIRVNQVRFDRTLADIEIYTADSEGRLSQLIQASSADYAGDDNWLLSGVVHSELQQKKVHETTEDTLLWKGLLSAKQASVLMLPLQALAPNDLVNTIKNLERNQLDTHSYEIVLWQQISLLPSLLAMALLSLPFLLGSVRSIAASQRVMIGGLIGISFYLVQQLSGHLAGILGINPSLIILTPPLILLAVAIATIQHKSV